jgi:hypothetical protein
LYLRSAKMMTIRVETIPMAIILTIMSDGIGRRLFCTPFTGKYIQVRMNAAPVNNSTNG